MTQRAAPITAKEAKPDTRGPQPCRCELLSAGLSGTLDDAQPIERLLDHITEGRTP